MEPSLDPLILSGLQSAFLEKISLAFSVVGVYALNIFYYMAIIELTLFGVIWALRQEPLIGHMLIKIVKLSFIVFVIHEYPYIVQTLIDSFTTVAFQASQPESIEYINNPGKIWEFGFDSSMSLLRIAVHYGSLNVSLGNLYLSLGLGILLLFALIGSQILLTIIGFYWIGLIGLLLIPFGAFTPLKNMFENALRQLLVQAARLATIVFVVGVGTNLWQKLGLGEFTQTDSISKPLGLLISALIIFILCTKLPSMVAQAVGQISSEFLPTEPSTTTGSESTHLNSSSSSVQAVAAGSQIDPNTYAISSSPSASSTTLQANLRQETASGSSLQPGGALFAPGQKNSVSDQQATEIARSISKETVHKIQQSLRNKNE